MHKTEDWISHQVDDAVWEYVCEFYDVDDPAELTDVQIADLDHFRTEEMSEYSVLQGGFSNIISYWESNA